MPSRFWPYTTALIFPARTCGRGLPAPRRLGFRGMQLGFAGFALRRCSKQRHTRKRDRPLVVSSASECVWCGVTTVTAHGESAVAIQQRCSIVELLHTTLPPSETLSLSVCSSIAHRETAFTVRGYLLAMKFTAMYTPYACSCWPSSTVKAFDDRYAEQGMTRVSMVTCEADHSCRPRLVCRFLVKLLLFETLIDRKCSKHQSF